MSSLEPVHPSPSPSRFSPSCANTNTNLSSTSFRTVRAVLLPKLKRYVPSPDLIFDQGMRAKSKSNMGAFRSKRGG